ncbi:hypothetical protein JCGZ_26247 [Jatropha curcas]|nr:hypothetical protein JCGZ_26247 [Jatropha curcas]
MTTMRKVSEHESSSSWYDDQVPFMQEEDSPKRNSQTDLAYHLSYSCKKELELQYQVPHDHFLQLPLLQNPKLLQAAAAAATVSCTSIAAYGLDINQTTTLQSSPDEHPHQTRDRTLPSLYNTQNNNNNNGGTLVDQVTDWRVLDKFVASQLSQDDVPKQNNNYSNAPNASIFHASDQAHMLARQLNKQESTKDNASTSAPGCQIEFWK